MEKNEAVRILVKYRPVARAKLSCHEKKESDNQETGDEECSDKGREELQRDLLG